jgi:predicted Rossmann fold flavoprotein
MRSIAIIGGGPAGFMAAIAAAEKSTGAGEPASVLVLDAAVPLATVLRTGGGRCNLAHATFGLKALAAQYPRGGKFLLSIFSRFGAQETIDWFQSRGLSLRQEEDGRLFPSSNRAEDVRDLLTAEARALGVRVRARSPVAGVRRAEGGFVLLTARGEERADRLVIATGGEGKNGHSATMPEGPAPSGHSFARNLGHTVTPLAPSLTALLTAERWTAGLAGLSLRGVRLIASYQGRAVADEQGDLLFTHGGISGPAAFRISSRCAFLPYSQGQPLCLQLCALPDLRSEEIEERIQDAAAARPRQQVLSLLQGLVPRSLAEVILSKAAAAGTLCGSQLSRALRKQIVSLLHRLPLAITGRERGGEMVTAGGVALSEVDPRTMESRLVPGLYFCGEALDIDGFTGGYNLQAAWSTGRIAGLAAFD